MLLSRRDVLLTAASLAAAAEPLTAQAASPSLPMIDTHQHLWDMKTIRLLWLSDRGAAKIATPHTMATYLREARGLGIVKTVYMEVDAAVEDQEKEAGFVIATCKSGKTPMKKGVISGRPGTPSFAAYARRYEKVPYIHGFRQILHPPDRPKGMCLEPQFIQNIQMLGDMGKTYDICIRPAELADGYQLADFCPQTRFVLDHCGNGEASWRGKGPEYQVWAQGITDFAKRKNVICKMSGVIKTCSGRGSKVEQLKPLVRHVIDAFGTDRVIWASDWPVCEFTASLKEWVDVAHALTSDLPTRDRKKIFHDNAAKFYRI